jgi:hypothetical protein
VRGLKIFKLIFGLLKFHYDFWWCSKTRNLFEQVSKVFVTWNFVYLKVRQIDKCTWIKLPELRLFL